MDTVKVNWSGGKDSTCAAMLHLLRGDVCRIVCYIPMFTEDIPLILKDHYEFIMTTSERFKGMGADVYIVTGETYYSHVKRRSTRGKFKGRIFGFPCVKPGWCGFKSASKVKALRGIDVGSYDYEDIGIATDEVRRQQQLTDKKRSILLEYGYSEQDAKDFCRAHGVLSPRYDMGLHRDGCALCPHAPAKERELWFAEYPEAQRLVKELQDLVKEERPGIYPLRGYQWFI